jgi:RNA polymerase sigma-70 factor (ECF subfamily)
MIVVTAATGLRARQQAENPPYHEEILLLFEQYRDPLLRYLLTFGLTVGDSEETVQEVFLALFQHLQRGKPRSNLRAWLFRVAHNLGLKRRYRELRGEAGITDSSAEHLVADPAPNPEDRLLAGEAQRRLLCVVGALAEQDRRCLVLRAEGLRYREIAKVLDMSLGAVSLSLTRSLARLARAAER